MNVLALKLMLVFLLPGAAQGPPASPVSYTEARMYDIRQTVQLPGTVEADTDSPVATEVEGYVTALLKEEGSRVQEGTPLIRLRTTNLELDRRATAAMLKEAQARYEQAERILRRATELFDDEAISQNEFDDAKADYLAREGQVEKLSADLERIDLDIERSTIRSPVAGVVVAEHVDVGSWIHVGDSVMEVLSTETLEVRVEVPDRYFAELSLNSPAEITLDTQPPITLSGTVSAIIPRADVRSRVFPVKVKVKNAGSALAGMVATVQLPVGTPQPALIVPKDALVAQGPMTVVYVLGDDGSATSVPVQSGQGAGAWVAVQGELQPGAKVIVRGNERVFPGQTFKGEPLEYDLP